MIDLTPLWLTVKLALITTVILFMIALPLCHWLAFSRYRFKAIPEAIISLPLVLPPSVIGFYLLLAFSPERGFGRFLTEHFNLQLVFSFPGLVIASVIYSLPFMVNPLLAGFKSIPASLREAAFTLGRSRFTTAVKIVLPNMKAAVLTALVMTFAHTIGEFGVVLMIGGSIPGETKTVSIAVYDEVQAMNYGAANVYAGILFAFTFLILLAVYWFGNKQQKAIAF